MNKQTPWVRRFSKALSATGPEGEALGVEGAKVIEDSLRGGLMPQALLVSVSGDHTLNRLEKLFPAIQSSVPICRVTDKVYRAVSGTESPQGIAGLFRQPKWCIDDVFASHSPHRKHAATDKTLAVVLCGIQDPGNVGTIVRSTEAFGATGVVATRGTADPWSPKAIRASAGSALRLPLLRGVAIPTLITQLRVNNLKIYATGASRGKLASHIEDIADRPGAIFIGNEGAGLSAEVMNAADGMLSIPLASTVESLNAGVAASILLYEISRIRRSAR